MSRDTHWDWDKGNTARYLLEAEGSQGLGARRRRLESPCVVVGNLCR
jgi:hypothetical protein